LESSLTHPDSSLEDDADDVVELSLELSSLSSGVELNFLRSSWWDEAAAEMSE
jgi:hypothetical protein